MAKSRTGRSKKSSGNGGHGSASKRSRSKDQRKARRVTIQKSSRHVRRRLRNALKLIVEAA